MSFRPGDETIGDMLVHELATSSEARGRDVRPIGRDVSRPLVMNLIRPTGLEHVLEGKLHEQVAERGWVQDACIIEHDWGHGLVAHIEVLAQRREFFECRLTPGLEIPLVGEQVFQLHTPMTPDLPTRDGSLIKQLHQMRARDV